MIYAPGTNLGIADPETVLEMIDACEKAGVDVISMGVILAWVTDMQQHGMISTNVASLTTWFPVSLPGMSTNIKIL